MLELINLDAEEVRQLAKAEGIELHLSDSTASGFKGVERAKRHRQSSHNRPFSAFVYIDCKKTPVGFPCRIVEQAALLYARYQKAEADGRGDAVLRQLLQAAEATETAEVTESAEVTQIEVVADAVDAADAADATATPSTPQ